MEVAAASADAAAKKPRRVIGALPALSAARAAGSARAETLASMTQHGDGVDESFGSRGTVSIS